jgi:hypothetical protein
MLGTHVVELEGLTSSLKQLSGGFQQAKRESPGD